MKDESRIFFFKGELKCTRWKVWLTFAEKERDIYREKVRERDSKLSEIET